MNLLKNFIDIIYPPKCPICGKFLLNEKSATEDGAILFCRACLDDFQKVTSPLCPVCGMPFVSRAGEDHLCEGCLRKRPFYEAAGAAYLYEGALMEAVHRFKYGPKNFLADSLGPLLAQFARSWLTERNEYLTIPVPLHVKRLRERGFNQSLLLARHVSGQLNTELDFLTLRRIRYTSPQTGLGKNERRKNVRRAFEVVTPEVVRGKTVLLVDDVFTTGNTLNECARVLKRHGCKKIFCLVLARAGNF
jgi:ComF family protein